MLIPLLWKVSCSFFSIILTVHRTAYLKLSSGLGPLVPRRLCEIILAQPATRLIAFLMSKIRGSRKQKDFLRNMCTLNTQVIMVLQ